VAPAIRPLLADKDPRVRMMAVHSLGVLDDRESIPAILDLHRREFTGAQGQYVFAEALSKLGERDIALAVARHYATSDNWNIRYFMAQALSRIESKEADAATVTLLPGELSRTLAEMKRGLGDRVFVELHQRLQRRTGQKLADDVSAWHAWWLHNHPGLTAIDNSIDATSLKKLLAEYRALKSPPRE
jgi:HEAT repeat protein